MITRRAALASFFTIAIPPQILLSGPAAASAEPWAQKLIDAAKRQIGVTVSYDPAYRKLAFPDGDGPRDSGVCTDVVIRAYRDGLNIDLQERVNRDMKRAFGAYPAIWGLKRPDPNIDHRRVPNLKVFFKRSGAERPVSSDAADYQPGDLVTQTLPGNLPHIALVSDKVNEGQSRPLVIHNIGGGARLEDTLFTFELTGHYRLAS